MNAENLFLSCDSERAERPASGPCYGSLDLRLADCMAVMREMPDNAYDLAIACHYRGHPLTACEIDADYYAAAVERVERETRQLSLFQ